jgi:hypothetical protein
MLFLLALLSSLIVHIIFSITENNNFYIWPIVIDAVLLIAILTNIFQAGKDLIKSVPINQEQK